MQSFNLKAQLPAFSYGQFGQPSLNNNGTSHLVFTQIVVYNRFRCASCHPELSTAGKQAHVFNFDQLENSSFRQTVNLAQIYII